MTDAQRSTTSPPASSVDHHFSGEYRRVLDLINQHAWGTLVYIFSFVLLVYFLGFSAQRALFFTLAEIPTLAVCAYIVWPNDGLRRRIPFFWVATAILAVLVSEARTTGSNASSSLAWGVGTLCWLLISYWLGLGLTWSARLARWAGRTLVTRRASDVGECIAILTSTWGATLLLASFIGKVLLPCVISDLPSSPPIQVLSYFLHAVGWFSIFHFVPIGLLVAGVVIGVGVTYSADPYQAVGLDVLRPATGSDLLRTAYFVFGLPFWVIVNVFGFIHHFSRLLVREVWRFARSWVARALFLLVGLVIGPVLLFIGHMVVLDLFSRVILHLRSPDNAFWVNLSAFLIVHLDALLAVSTYALAQMAFEVRYHNETVDTVLPSLHAQIAGPGVNASIAVSTGMLLSAFVVFAVPVCGLLPGGAGFGFFSTAYTVISISALLVGTLAGRRKH